MDETQGAVTVNTGAMELVLDTQEGLVRSLAVEGKRLIADNRTPLLFATLMESDAYDGATDYAPRRFLKAEYRCEGLTVRRTARAFEATGKGALEFPDGDALDFTLQLGAEQGEKHLRISVTLSRRGEFRHRFIREVGVQQPLVLRSRKRVVQAGDQGLRWDTRHRRQFHMHVGFATDPDHNWWRHFYVDQDSARSYTVWRAESEDTAGLWPFQGRRAPGWMTLYDELGGALFAYGQLADRAPKCLYADAEGGGKGVVYLLSPTQPARAPSDPALERALFGAAHHVDWVFFAGEEAFAQPDRELARLWGVASLSSDGPVQHDLLDDEMDLWDAAPAEGDLAPLVTGGVPLPRGAVSTPDRVRLFVRGNEAPVQSRVLGYWPDRSIKWLLLVFPLDGSGGYGFQPGSGDGDRLSFQVTLRKGEAIPCELLFGGGVRAGRITAPLEATQDGDRVSLHTGPLSFALSTGRNWLPSASLNGREMIRDDGEPQAFVDFLRPPGTYPVGMTHPEGVLDPGPVRIEKIELEEAGPLRAVVRLEGRALCQEPPRIIMRVEAYAGRPYVRLDHSVEFLHQDPRRAFVRRMGLRLPLTLTQTGRRLAAGAQQGPVELEPAAVTGLRHTSHANYEVWQACEGKPWREVREAARRSRGWLDAADARGGLAVVQRDMWQEYPKELTVRQDSAFEVGLWPASARLMDVRRYSNYPHPAQGESASDSWDPGWVLKTYYKNDPFVGVTKTHETLLFFHGPDVTPAQVDSVAADFQSRPLVYAGWDWYAETGVTLEHVDPSDPKLKQFSANMHNLADWWLFHQKAWNWYGMWDYGDVGHRFRAGYGRIFPPDALAEILQLPPEERAQVDIRKYPQKLDYFTQNDWAYDNGRWGWGNTEGLPNLFMAMQYLLTGRRDLFFFLEADARHVRDVDARHAGKWFGLGTRHGVQHWSDGNHEERQTTFTEQRFHYFLTGEHRTREWNQALSDNWYLKGRCRRHAAHSGRTYGLLFRWEITGDPALAETMRHYMHAFAQPEGVAISPDVAFPSGKLAGEAGEINGGSMFFHTFGAMHALLEYHRLTGDARLRDAIIKTADFALATNAAGGIYRKAVAFAARHAPDGEKYRSALREWAGGGGCRYVFQMAPANRAHWSGETAFLVGNVSGGMFWANDAHYVMSALQAEPKLSESQRAQLKALEERPVQAQSRLPRGSWQSEYDRPEFADYLKKPPRPGQAEQER